MPSFDFQNFGLKGVPNQLPDYLSSTIPELGILGIYPALSIFSYGNYRILRRGQGAFNVPQVGGIIRVVQDFNAGPFAAYYPTVDSMIVSVALDSDNTPYQGLKGFVPKLGGIEITYWRAFRYIAGTTWVPTRFWLSSVVETFDLRPAFSPIYSPWDNVGFLPLVNNGLSLYQLPTSDAFVTVSTEFPLTVEVVLCESVGIVPIMDS